MNEMQLFEVGLSERYGGGYFAKRYVIANDDLDARSKMRRKILQEEKAAWPDYTEEEWEGVKEKDNWPEDTTLEDWMEYKEERMDMVANLLVTRVVHVGKAIV